MAVAAIAGMLLAAAVPHPGVADTVAEQIDPARTGVASGGGAQTGSFTH